MACSSPRTAHEQAPTSIACSAGMSMRPAIVGLFVRVTSFQRTSFPRFSVVMTTRASWPPMPRFDDPRVMPSANVTWQRRVTRWPRSYERSSSRRVASPCCRTAGVRSCPSETSAHVKPPSTPSHERPISTASSPKRDASARVQQRDRPQHPGLCRSPHLPPRTTNAAPSRHDALMSAGCPTRRLESPSPGLNRRFEAWPR